MTKIPPGPHLTAFCAPRLQNLIRWALAPDRPTATKLGSWKPLQIRGFFPASLCSVLGVLGYEPQKTSRQMTLCSPPCPCSKAPMPRTVLRNSTPSEALARDRITTSGQGVSHGERKGYLNNINPRGRSLEVEGIRNKRHRNLKQDLEGPQV